MAAPAGQHSPPALSQATPVRSTGSTAWLGRGLGPWAGWKHPAIQAVRSHIDMAALAELDQRFGTVLSFCMGFPASDFDECAPMVWGHGVRAEAAVAQLFKLVSEPTQ